MKFSIKISLALLTLSLIGIPACTGADPSGENQEDQMAPALGEDIAPTLEYEQGRELIPSGILAGSRDGSGIEIYTREGKIAAQYSLPSAGFTDPEHIHIASKFTGDTSSIPIVYHGWDPNQALVVSVQDSISTLRKTSSFLALVGARGQSALAFSEVLIENDAPHSYLYTGNLENLDTAASFCDLIDKSTQMALMPVGIDAVNDNPQGVWYTKAGWGIGGADLIFPITSGLFYSDLKAGSDIEHLAPERSFQGISPDHSMTGSVAFDFKGDRSMTITELKNSRDTNFPLRSDSDRGAGFAVFSPNNQFTAWLEASGSFMGVPASYQSVVRVGDLTSGNVVIEIQDSMLTQSLGWPVSFIKPVGWLDNQSLLIEVRGIDWGDVSLVLLDLDGRTLTYFCDGNFAGFVYP